jgi:hypothetical protein
MHTDNSWLSAQDCGQQRSFVRHPRQGNVAETHLLEQRLLVGSADVSGANWAAVIVPAEAGRMLFRTRDL